MGVRSQGYKDDKLYLLAVPLSIRSFIRETNGALAKAEQRRAEVSFHRVPHRLQFQMRSLCDIHHVACHPQRAAKREQRRNFDERPKFGTVQDAIFVPGEEGLIATGDEDEEGNEMRKIPEWEKKIDAMA